MTNQKARHPLFVFSLALISLTVHVEMSESQTSTGTKLVVDDGRYAEEPFVRQVAVTADDRFVLTSDFNNGVRTFDIANGKLINYHP